MSQSVSLALVIDALGLMQCLLFAGLLFSLHGRANPANRFLIAFLLIYAVTYLDYLLEDLEFYRLMPHLTLLTSPLDLWLAPSIYFYVDDMTSGVRSQASWQRWRHFVLPSLLASLLLLPVQLLSADAKIALFIDDADLDEEALASLGVGLGHLLVLLLGMVAAALFFTVQVSAYLIAAIRLLRRHGRNVREIFSNVENRTLIWLRNLLLLLTGYWLISAPAEIADLGFVDLPDGFWQVMNILELAMIYGLGIAAIRQPSVFVSPEFT